MHSQRDVGHKVYSFNHYAAEIKPVTRVRITIRSGHFGRGRDSITHSKNISAAREAIYQILVSRSKSVLPSKPMQALRKLSSALRCLLRLLTTSVPTRKFQLVLTLTRQGKVFTGLDERSLEHVGEKGEHRVQGCEVLLFARLAVLDASQELSEDSQIQDKRGGKEGVLSEDSMSVMIET